MILLTVVATCLTVAVVAVVMFAIFDSGPTHQHPDSEYVVGRPGGGWGLMRCREPGCEWTELY